MGLLKYRLRVSRPLERIKFDFIYEDDGSSIMGGKCNLYETTISYESQVFSCLLFAMVFAILI